MSARFRAGSGAGLVAGAAALLLATSIAATGSVAAAEPKLETEDQKILYAIGLAVSQQVREAGFAPAEIDRIVAGFSDALQGGKERVDLNEYGPKIQGFMQERMAARSVEEQEASAAYLSKAEKSKGAEKTDSGLIYVETQTGSGDAPAGNSTVEVHYHGTLRDGTVFDSSVERGATATFPLDRVIPCWTEALQKMRVGGKATIYCPAGIAYGDRGSGKIPPGAAIRFDVELLGIQ